jgi:hypothetical protein
MLRYNSGEEPKVGDKVRDGLGTSWQGVVIDIHGPNHKPPISLDIGSGLERIEEALVIEYENLRDPVIESSPEDELVLIERGCSETNNNT